MAGDGSAVDDARSVDSRARAAVMTPVVNATIRGKRLRLAALAADHESSRFVFISPAIPE